MTMLSLKSPRLSPIEKPKSLLLKLTYMYSKWKVGKVIGPIKIIYARMPECLITVLSLKRSEERLKLSTRLKLFIRWYVSMLNGCAFCKDLTQFQIQKKMDTNLLDELIDYKSSTQLSDAEKAALQYVEQITLKRQVENNVFEQLRKHFDEDTIVRISWLTALENYYNLLGIPLGLQSDNLCYRESFDKLY